MTDIVARIRTRFPRPKDAEDGLLSNAAADEVERLREAIALLGLRSYVSVPA